MRPVILLRPHAIDTLGPIGHEALKIPQTLPGQGQVYQVINLGHMLRSNIHAVVVQDLSHKLPTGGGTSQTRSGAHARLGYLPSELSLTNVLQLRGEPDIELLEFPGIL